MGTSELSGKPDEVLGRWGGGGICNGLASYPRGVAIHVLLVALCYGNRGKR